MLSRGDGVAVRRSEECTAIPKRSRFRAHFSEGPLSRGQRDGGERRQLGGRAKMEKDPRRMHDPARAQSRAGAEEVEGPHARVAASLSSCR